MLIGKNVDLRIIESSDAEIVRQWKNNPENYSYFANQDFISDLRQKEWFAKKLVDQTGLYLIILEKKTNQAIGMTLLENISHRNQNAIWGIYIGETQYRKRIYALEATMLIIDYGFNYLNLQKIYGNTLVNNEKGRRFHKKAGFTEEAVFKNHNYVNGEYTDLIWISLFKNDWESTRNRIITEIGVLNQ